MTFSEWRKDNEKKWFHLYAKEAEMCAVLWKDACVSEDQSIAEWVEKNYDKLDKATLVHEIRRGKA